MNRKRNRRTYYRTRRHNPLAAMEAANIVGLIFAVIMTAAMCAGSSL